MELQVEGRNLEVQPGWHKKILAERNRLVRHHAGLVHHLRISFTSTPQHKEGGYQVVAVASVPNDTVVVRRKGGAVMPLIVEAFDVLGLRLKEIQRRQQQIEQGREPQRPSLDTGIVRRLSPHESYGFIMTTSGREIYFHENALKDLSMEALAEGDAVRFGETIGDKGPCAAWVRAAK